MLPILSPSFPPTHLSFVFPQPTKPPFPSVPFPPPRSLPPISSMPSPPILLALFLFPFPKPDVSFSPLLYQGQLCYGLGLFCLSEHPVGRGGIQFMIDSHSPPFTLSLDAPFTPVSLKHARTYACMHKGTHTHGRIHNPVPRESCIRTDG